MDFFPDQGGQNYEFIPTGITSIGQLSPSASPSSQRLSDEWMDVAASGGRGNK
jgi:hypothetical protein